MSLLFSRSEIGTLHLRNRFVMSPMQQYRGARDGRASSYHVHHYSRPARGGVGLVLVESTAVSIEGRLLSDDIGIFDNGHVEPLRAIVDAVHEEGASIGIQLCHGGRKSTPPEGCSLLAPSEIAYDYFYGVPQAMTQADIRHVTSAFAAAARRSVAAGFDLIEIHAAHGYLIHQFLSPLSNTREDEYGGSVEGRGRFLREVFTAVRDAVGSDYPLIVRVSATDFDDNGLMPADVAELLRPLLRYGLAAVDVSSGALLPAVPPGVGPEYQVPFAAEIKAALDLPVIAVGLIRKASRAEQILLDEKADFIAVGRPVLERPDCANDWRFELDGV